jgi:hypothetical protein
MSSRLHNKFHRHSHHTYPNGDPRFPDSGHDPIASPASPFLGDFVLQGGLSASAPLSAYAGYFASNNAAIIAQSSNVAISASGDVKIIGNTTSYGNTVINGNLTVAGSATNLITMLQILSSVTITVSNSGVSPALIVNQSGNNDIVDFQDGGISKFFIDGAGQYAGYVGINTNTPTSQLTVVGDISSTGTTTLSNVVFTGAVISTLTTPVTATGEFLVLNINGVTNRAIQIWNF